MKFVQDQKIAPHTGVMTEGKGGNELWEIKRRTKTYINSKTLLTDSLVPTPLCPSHTQLQV